MNSKDLRNLAEAYESIQEQRRRATRIPGATGEKPTGSLRSGNLSFPGDRSGAYDAAKQKLSTPKVEVPKIKTPPETQGILGTRNVPSTQELIQQRGGAPKPQFPGSANTGQSFPKPPRVPRDAGAFARQRLMAKPPTAATLSRGARLLKGLKGPLAVGAEIAADATLTPVAKAAGTELGKAMTRGVASLTGTTDKMRSRLPSYYGAAGPDLTRDIVQGVKSREPKTGMSNIPPAEGPVNNPNFGKKPAPVKPAPAAKLSAAAKDFDRAFAAAREKGEKTFPWRGKIYNTKLKGE